MDETSSRLKLSRRNFVQLAMTGLASGTLFKFPGLEQSAWSENVLSEATTFAPIALRGYGSVSGFLRRKVEGSVLEVACEDEAKAKLFQAKYLSDLGVLPGVTMTHGKSPAVYAVYGQGFVASYNSGNKVTILAATSDRQVQALSDMVKPVGVGVAQVDVPMYLDRWDKFSFRHYYRPWAHPPGTTDATYDYTADFDYAEREGRAGFLLPDSLLATDSAQGMLNYGWWDWMEYEARKRNLPVELHLAANAGSEPTWLLNTYREQTEMKMPGFTGNLLVPMSPYGGGQGILSWSATTGEDAILGALQQSVRRFGNEANVVSFLEPHGELQPESKYIFLEYGPVADAGYRQYLQGKYGSPTVVAARWGSELKTWDDVHVPEMVSFAGWSKEALDVGQIWRVGYETLNEPAKHPYFYDVEATPNSQPAPEDWFHADFDDSSWPEVPGGGNDQQLFLEKRPAVFRHTFNVSATWKEKNPRVWLYEWDLNRSNQSGRQEVRAVLNGKEVGRSKVARDAHWSAMEVTEALQEGKNILAVRVPQGYIAYKTYLSPVEPKQYPHLGEGLNAQWVDFIDFTQWARSEMVRRGMEMIRQVAPNQGIVLMSPDGYTDGMKSLAEAYGGEFHNTGYMAAFYADFLPSLMRGANLPFSTEPGGPANDLNEFKKFFGLWQAEGVQAVDYFIHIGDILWNPEIKAYYEARRKQFTLMGQRHYPKAELGFLSSSRISLLAGFPWDSASNTVLGSGYWYWNPTAFLFHRYPYDGLSQSSFASGDADAYRVIIDCNTTIMDETMVSEIEKWVRNGGTFITLAQTGRHTPEKPDSWPIARLTGYNVIKIDHLKPDGNVDETGTLRSASGEVVFDGMLNGVIANGLHMERAADDAQDLLLWNDGTVAAGARPLGKGFIVELGAKFTGAKVSDHIEPGDADRPDVQHMRQMLTALLKWRKVEPEPGHLNPNNDLVMLRHAVSNNGLYDVWTLWNQSPTKAQTVSVVIDKDQKPPFFFDIADRKKVPLAAASLDNITLDPMDTRVLLTPRQQIAEGPSAWFDLQRKWWRGTTRPAPRQLPEPDHRFSSDLSQDWKFKTLDTQANAGPFSKAHYDDKDWPSRSLGIWDVKDTGGRGHGVFRKLFTVPAHWSDGLVSIWLADWQAGGNGFVEMGCVWLDGKEVKPLNGGPFIAIGLPTLRAGTSHTLAVEVESRGTLAGLRGQCWLSFEPTAPAKLDLRGRWSPSVDGLVYTKPIALPGSFDTQFLRRTFYVDAKYDGKNAVLIVDGDPALVSVLINGKLVRHHHHMIGARWSLTLTPFVHFGADNEIQLVRWDKAGPGFVREAFLGFFDPTVYP